MDLDPGILSVAPQESRHRWSQPAQATVSVEIHHRLGRSAHRRGVRTRPATRAARPPARDRETDPHHHGRVRRGANRPLHVPGGWPSGWCCAIGDLHGASHGGTHCRLSQGGFRDPRRRASRVVTRAATYVPGRERSVEPRSWIPYGEHRQVRFGAQNVDGRRWVSGRLTTSRISAPER